MVLSAFEFCCRRQLDSDQNLQIEHVEPLTEIAQKIAILEQKDISKVILAIIKPKGSMVRVLQVLR